MCVSHCLGQIKLCRALQNLLGTAFSDGECTEQHLTSPLFSARQCHHVVIRTLIITARVKPGTCEIDVFLVTVSNNNFPLHFVLHKLCSVTALHLLDLWI